MEEIRHIETKNIHLFLICNVTYVHATYRHSTFIYSSNLKLRNDNTKSHA
jgi:hypothetical protein